MSRIVDRPKSLFELSNDLPGTLSAKAIRYRRMSPRVIPYEDVSSESIPERQLSMWGMS